MRDYKEMYTALLGSPFIEQSQLTRLVLQKAFELEPEELDRLVIPPERLAEKAQEGAGDKKDSPEEIALTAVAKAYGRGERPDIEAQIEELAGLDPSITHEGRMETLASQQFADQATHGEQIAPAPSTPPVPILTNAPSSPLPEMEQSFNG
jgi:hypothetical protein